MINKLLYYYQDYRIQYYFLKYFKDRECVVIPCKKSNSMTGHTTRNMRIHNIQSFQFYLKFLRMFESDERTFNFYYSMARFKNGVPFRDTKQGNLKEDFSEWNKNCYREIDAYDMLLDVDAGDFTEMNFAVETAMNLKDIFDFKKVPHHLRFSGKGFHFLIPYEYFPKDLSFNPNDDNNIYRCMRDIAKKLNEECSEMIDYNIYDSRRVAKVPMSLSVYDEGDFVCSPITRKDLDGFDISDYRMENFKKKGVQEDILYNQEGSIEWLKE